VSVTTQFFNALLAHEGIIFRLPLSLCRTKVVAAKAAAVSSAAVLDILSRDAASMTEDPFKDRSVERISDKSGPFDGASNRGKQRYANAADAGDFSIVCLTAAATFCCTWDNSLG
jgi:hypothetical protein